MPLQLGAERPQRSAHQPHGAIRVGAAAAAVDLIEPTSQQPRLGAAAASELPDLAGDRGQAEPARAALAGGLAGQVAHHPGGLSEPAGARGQRGDQPGAGPGVQVCEPGRGERPGGRPGRLYPGPEVPAEQQRLRRRGRAAGLMYAASMSAVPADLAAALADHGARIAMELDINPEWVQLDAASRPGGVLTTEIPGQYRPADQYLAGWTRDFFAVLALTANPARSSQPSARLMP